MQTAVQIQSIPIMPAALTKTALAGESTQTGFESSLNGAMTAARNHASAKNPTRSAPQKEAEAPSADLQAAAQAAATAPAAAQASDASGEGSQVAAVAQTSPSVQMQPGAASPIVQAIPELPSMPAQTQVQEAFSLEVQPETGVQITAEQPEAPPIELQRPILEPPTDAQGAVNSSVFEEAGRKLDTLGEAAKQDTAPEAAKEAQPQEAAKPQLTAQEKAPPRSSDSTGFLKAIRREEEQAQSHQTGTAPVSREEGPQGAQQTQQANATREAPRLYEQLSQPVHQSVLAGKTELVMQLAPQELGQVHIKMVLDGGQLALEITAATQKATQQLAKQLDSLAASLRANGVQVQEISLNTPAQQTEAKQNAQQDYTHDHSQNQRGHSGKQQEEAPEGFEEALTEQAMSMSGML